ncbi:MAG: helix-turn-helix transcriptional regulator [Planctomycetota bacterium]
MNITDDYTTGVPFNVGPTAPAAREPGKPEHKAPADPAAEARPLHRIARIREQQGVSIRSAARRMGVTMERVRQEERPDSNLSLADLIRWQEALEVPLIDLLVEDAAPVSAPVLARARWLRLMKTVKALMESSESEGVSRMAAMLETQVLEVMPELEDVTAWHSVGQRRTQDEAGRIAERPVSANFASDGLR